MIKVLSRIGLLALGLIILNQGVEAADSGVKSPVSLVKEKKTLNRKEDPIVILGNKLKNNLGKDIAKMSLFSCVDGKVKPIPFQIDEIMPDGNWVLPSASPALQEKIKKGKIKPEKDVDDGHLDDNDQLVFMIRDSGDRVSADRYPAGAAAVDGIRLVDPIDGGTSWVYLCSFEGNPPLSDKKYVEYIWSKGQIEGQIINRDAVIGFDPEMANSPNYMSVWGSDNILDRMKIRFKFSIFGLNFYLNETNLVSEMSFYKAGPVRIIRRIKTSIRFTRFFKTPMAAVENLYYDKIQVLPIRIDIPMNIKPFSKYMSIRVRGGAEYRDLKGWKVKLETDPNWFAVNGKMDEIEKNAKGEGAKMIILWGPKGALLYDIVLDRKPDGTHQETPITTDILYLDDETYLEPPEKFPGQVPGFAYWMKNLEKLSKGTFYFYVNQYNITGYKAEMEKEYLDILDKEVEVYVD